MKPNPRTTAMWYCCVLDENDAGTCRVCTTEKQRTSGRMRDVGFKYSAMRNNIPENGAKSER